MLSEERYPHHNALDSILKLRVHDSQFWTFVIVSCVFGLDGLGVILAPEVLPAPRCWVQMRVEGRAKNCERIWQVLDFYDPKSFWDGFKPSSLSMIWLTYAIFWEGLMFWVCPKRSDPGSRKWILPSLDVFLPFNSWLFFTSKIVWRPLRASCVPGSSQMQDCTIRRGNWSLCGCHGWNDWTISPLVVLAF